MKNNQATGTEAYEQEDRKLNANIAKIWNSGRAHTEVRQYTQAYNELWSCSI
jgi:hypothetical protein